MTGNAGVTDKGRRNLGSVSSALPKLTMTERWVTFSVSVSCHKYESAVLIVPSRSLGNECSVVEVEGDLWCCGAVVLRCCVTVLFFWCSTGDKGLVVTQVDDWFVYEVVVFFYGWFICSCLCLFLLLFSSYSCSYSTSYSFMSLFLFLFVFFFV